MAIRRLLILAAAIATLATGPIHATPVVEDWSLARSGYDVHAVAPDRFVIESGSKHNTAGKVARFSVKPGDVFNMSSGERSEVVLGGWRETSRFRVTGSEGVEYYRISVKLDPDWQSPSRNAGGQRWGTFFQLHGPDEYSAPPAVALHAEDKFGLFVLGGDLASKAGGKRFLTNAGLNAGKWVDFILAIKWAIDAEGTITVFRRDEGNANWETVADIQSVPTLQYRGIPEVHPHYWKAGFYRSQSNHVNSLLLGRVIRARSFSEAAK